MDIEKPKMRNEEQIDAITITKSFRSAALHFKMYTNDDTWSDHQ